MLDRGHKRQCLATVHAHFHAHCVHSGATWRSAGLSNTRRLMGRSRSGGEGFHRQPATYDASAGEGSARVVGVDWACLSVSNFEGSVAGVNPLAPSSSPAFEVGESVQGWRCCARRSSLSRSGHVRQGSRTRRVALRGVDVQPTSPGGSRS